VVRPHDDDRRRPGPGARRNAREAAPPRRRRRRLRLGALVEIQDTDPELFAQQRVIVGKTIVALKTALVAAGLGDAWITYTPRYNAFVAGGAYGTNEFRTDGEGVDVVAYVAANSEYGADAIDYVNYMMYDIDAREAFRDSAEGFFQVSHYASVLASHAAYLPLSKMIMGFEPGPQAYTGVWGGMDRDEATISYVKNAGAGGVMFWAMNEAAVANNGKSVGENAIDLANFAAAL